MPEQSTTEQFIADESTLDEVTNLLSPDREEIKKEAEKPEFTADEAGVEEAGDSTTVEGEQSSEEDAWSMKVLAEEAGITVEDLYTTPIRFGEDKEPTTLGEMKDLYSKHRASSEVMHEKLQSLDEMKLQGQAAQAAMAQYAPQAQEAQQRLTTLEQEWNAVDWDNIPEDQMPAYKSYAENLQSGYKMAKVALDNAQVMLQNTDSQLNAIKAAEEAAKQEEWGLKAAEEWPKILQANEWKDQNEAQAGMNTLYAKFESYGLSPEEAHRITDARLFQMASDAIKFESASKVDLKAVKPKAKRPVHGKRVPASVKKKREAAEQLKRARSGSEADQLAAIAKLIP